MKLSLGIREGWKEDGFKIWVYCLLCYSDSIGSKLNCFLSPGPVCFAHDVNLWVIFPCPWAFHCFLSSAQLRREEWWANFGGYLACTQAQPTTIVFSVFVAFLMRSSEPCHTVGRDIGPPLYSVEDLQQGLPVFPLMSIMTSWHSGMSLPWPCLTSLVPCWGCVILLGVLLGSPVMSCG